MSDNTTHTLPAYLPYSMGLLWLWSGTQPLFFMPEMSLDLLHSVGIPDPLQWPTLIAASLLDIGFAFFMLQPLSLPFRNMVAAIDNRRGIQPDYCLQAARNVDASICTFDEKSADYGYFVFPVSIRRR